MPGFNWYRLFNLEDFEDQEVVSIEKTVFFEGVGEKNILITKGNEVSVLFDETFLTIGLNDANPFRYDERAIYLDELDDVWLGIYSED